MARGAGGSGGGGGRVPQGASFAMSVAMGAGFAAAVLAFLGAFLVGMATASDPGEAMDAAGVQAARLLAAGGADRWKPGFGTTQLARGKALGILQSKLADMRDDKDRGAVAKSIEEFKSGKAASGAEWKPGLDMVLPPNDPADALMLAAADGLKRDAVVANGLLGAAIREGKAPPIAQTGAVYDPPGNPKMVGETRVFVMQGVRQYEHPIKNAANAPTPVSAVVAISTSGFEAPSPVASAAAAAGAAFVGAFLLGMMLSMGPVKAVRRLAMDADNLANGDLNARVSVGGPDVVQAAARNVQRLAQYAATVAAAAAAEPQVVEQQVVVQPVAEVSEGLAPTKSFKKPDEFEIEATTKTCPDLGNDWHDIVNVDEGSVGLIVADIPNLRGVRGALLMSQVRAIFRAMAPGEKSPAEVLRNVNRAFAADLPRGIYVTAMYAIVDQATGICKVASAQHLPLVVWKASVKKTAKVAPEGIALGLDAGPVFDKTITEKAIQLDRGDRIVLFTDGAIAARNASGAEYGEERFYYVLNREAPKNSAACVNFVANDVDLFHEGAQQADDFTIVTLRKMK